MHVVFNGENPSSISFLILEKSIGDHLNNGSIFEQRELKYANTWVGGGRACGQKSLQITSFVFLLYS